MSVNEAEARIKAQVWQAIAQGKLDLSGIEKEKLTALVEFVTEAALMEVDDELEKAVSSQSPKTAVSAPTDEFEEKVLWEGRPFLSISLYYTLTNERLRITEGVLGKSRENLELVRVQDVDYTQKLSERMMNIGDIAIRSHDPSHPIIILQNIKDPEKVQEVIRRAVLSARKRHNLVYREQM
jgi:hypothetical protein